MQITTVGLDLAKNVFQVHGVNRHGKVELRKQIKRDQVGHLPRDRAGRRRELVGQAHHPPQQERCCRGARQQERENHRGVARTRPRVQGGLRTGIEASTHPPAFPASGKGAPTTRIRQVIPTADCSGDQQADGTIGQTVVGTARAGRGTQNACKRSRRRLAEPIRDSEFVSH
jgi:hypothetical protein